jgi:cbb3-type cytochrome oxidase subunit 1
MKGLPFTFFATGTVAVLIGMVWGLQMGGSEDFTLAPAHAHLNLVGWVTFALFGIYYHLTPSAAQAQLAKIHYAFALPGLVIMVPGIALSVLGTNHAIVIVGSMLTFVSMLIFAFTVFRHGLGSKT